MPSYGSKALIIEKTIKPSKEQLKSKYGSSKVGDSKTRRNFSSVFWKYLIRKIQNQ
jgi:hypothetical protein